MGEDIHIAMAVMKDVAWILRQKAFYQRHGPGDENISQAKADALDEVADAIETAIAPKPKDIQINHTEPA